MLANYGYNDASGVFFITIDTDKCDGCGDCVPACPRQIFAKLAFDPNDPLREEPVALVHNAKLNKLKYECGPCKPSVNRPPLPCVAACKKECISHSW